MRNSSLKCGASQASLPVLVVRDLLHPVDVLSVEVSPLNSIAAAFHRRAAASGPLRLSIFHDF
jgi:hypothetical protein